MLDVKQLAPLTSRAREARRREVLPVIAEAVSHLARAREARPSRSLNASNCGLSPRARARSAA